MKASDILPVMGTAGISGRLLFQSTAAFFRTNAKFSSKLYCENEDTVNLTLVLIFIFKMFCSYFVSYLEFLGCTVEMSLVVYQNLTNSLSSEQIVLETSGIVSTAEIIQSIFMRRNVIQRYRTFD